MRKFVRRSSTSRAFSNNIIGKVKNIKVPGIKNAHRFFKRANTPFARRIISYVAVAMTFLIVGFISRRFVPVALVDGEPVSRVRFNERLLKNAGLATLREVVVEDIVQKEIEKRGSTVKKAEVEKQLDVIYSDIASQGSTIDQYLAQTGQTQDEFEDQVKTQLIIKKMFEKESEVTQDEVEEYYGNNGIRKGEGAILVSQELAIKQAIAQQKLLKAYSDWIDKEFQKRKIQILFRP